MVLLVELFLKSNKKKISLTKPGVNEGIYSNIDSKFSDNEFGSAELDSGGTCFFSLAATTFKAKKVIINLVSGSPIGTIDFGMDKDMIYLPPSLNISLEKRWIDPKVVKIQVEVPIKKFFALNINFSAVEEKSVTAKTHLIKAISLAREKRIIVNSNLKKQEIHSNRAVIIKKIPMDTPKEMIVAALAEFGKIKSIKIQLIGLWQKAVVEFAEIGQAVQLATKWSFLIGKDSVQVAMAIEDCETWASRDQFKALLFTLSVGTTVYDLSTLLEEAGRKTCIINCLLNFGNKICYAVVGFEFEDTMESAYNTEPIFGGVKLSWTRLNLVCCKKYGFLGYSALECGVLLASTPKPSKVVRMVTLEKHCLQLAKLYAKKTVPIFCPAAFNGKFDFVLHNHLSSLECSLELLADQVSDILRKLSYVELVSLVFLPLVPPPIVSTFLAVDMNSDMTLDDTLIHLILFSVVVTNMVANISLSSSKILTTKVGDLEFKIVALKISVESVLEKLDHLCSGLGSLVPLISQ
ncbi:hypothetical protein G9A89_009649 [Geosiphon pyriformis]|nr:hypothetical protein G9A89_009649 [Geosiphon pyriformis]